jgi:hypothetical protein
MIENNIWFNIREHFSFDLAQKEGWEKMFIHLEIVVYEVKKN